MTDSDDLLVEIGTEELPPRALPRLSEAFEEGLCAGLAAAGLVHGRAHRYAAPRRLAVWIESVAGAQADRTEARRGPALAAAFDPDGRPTSAAQGFARACGVRVEDLGRLETDKGTWLQFSRTVRGRRTVDLLPEIVRTALAGLPIARRMRWGEGRVEFVRPVHWALLLFGEACVETELLGVHTGRHSHGHRFHHPGPVAVQHPGDYARVLREPGRVLADFTVRRDAIRVGVDTAAAALGGRALWDEALLDEVTALVEWPVPLAGGFERRFLDLPREVLIATLQIHQRYFAVEDADGALLPNFVTVSNIESRDPAQVIAGNERVIRPRLADATFFREQDRREPLAARREGLRAMVFQERLGSLHDKSERVARLVTEIAPRVGSDPALAVRAAQLGQCDLLTRMVGEFPELQGVMGRHYARLDGEPEAVAAAIEEQYQPRHAGDALPQSPAGAALALAERLDTLVGIFAVGLRPGGDKDPFALRRAAIGILRILIEGGRDLDLQWLLDRAGAAYRDFPRAADAVPEVLEFILERLRAYYLERGIAPDVFDAVLVCRPTRPVDFDRRVRAVAHFRGLPEAASLSAANKRLRNILRQAGYRSGAAVDPGRLQAPEEHALYEEFEKLRVEVRPWIEAGEYTQALAALAGLKDPVDRFFDAVMVMAEDEGLRANRLALLHAIGALFLRIADVSRLQG
ncbi:glycine--tRNA ligase beta subunit [bacterium BMS3Abin12]|nr:glycine--tRNA ligase beta subunit [bacterium BMS3Abin12]HDJ86710.1 glycine--tRNA ligase subunit beta [Chromatiales bacterium]